MTDMTDQVNGQIPVPGLAGVAAPPVTDDPRRCKQPGCGIELPAAAGAMHAPGDEAGAALEAADGARADADAAEARARAIRARADARVPGIRQQAEAAIAQASGARDAARAGRDAALAEAAQARQH